MVSFSVLKLLAWLFDTKNTQNTDALFSRSYRTVTAQRCPAPRFAQSLCFLRVLYSALKLLCSIPPRGGVSP
jgi:hypothetical protein